MKIVEFNDFFEFMSEIEKRGQEGNRIRIQDNPFQLKLGVMDFAVDEYLLCRISAYHDWLKDAEDEHAEIMKKAMKTKAGKIAVFERN